MSMETDSPVVYHGTSESRFPQEEVKKIAVPELTAEERDLLRQCNRESFYYRCLPLSIAGIAAVHFAARRGFIATHPRWGTASSMTGAALIGWLVGKFSYRTRCEDKFVHLQNSQIGDAVRKKRGYTSERFQSEYPKSQTSEDFSSRDDSFSFYGDSEYHPSTGSLNLDVDKNIQYSGLDDRERPSTDSMYLFLNLEMQKTSEDFSSRDDSFSFYGDSEYHSSTGSLNLDVDKNIQYSGLDDRERPSTDREMQFSSESEPIRSLTYEDLRQRNREEFERSQRRYFPQTKDISPPVDQRPYSNVDSTPPRRYNSDIGEGERRTIW